MKRVLSAVGVVLSLPVLASAQITGFSGFGPVNHTVGNAPNNIPTNNPEIAITNGGSTFTLTTPVNSQATSAYFPTAQNISSWAAKFDYTAVYTGTAPNFVAADGVSLNFLSASAPTTTLGLPGNGRGIGGVTNSASVQFDLYNGTNNFPGRVGIGTNGVNPTFWSGISGASLVNNTVEVELFYSNNVVTNRVTDRSGPVPKRAYHQFPVDIGAAVGGTQAIVGFSGSTGGISSRQSISNFSFTPGAAALTLPTFNPIAIGGFNQTIIVPKEAAPLDAFNYVTATMDNGTNLSIGATGFTLYENGIAGAPANRGLPASGSVISSVSTASHKFQMPTYNSGGGSGTYVPDSILIDVANPTATMTLNTPAKYSELSFLSVSGNGSNTINYTLNYSDGSTLNMGSAMTMDWYNRGTLVQSSGARLNPGTGAFQESDGNINLFSLDFDVPESDKLISSVTLSYAGTANGHVAFLGLSGYLAAVGGIPGDYNNNGTVDAADYTVWADNFGRTGTNIPGDGNGSGTVDAADYTVWADNFGRTTPPGASVPEPSGLALAGVAGLGLLGRRRR